jgi:hypothetical protein
MQVFVLKLTLSILLTLPKQSYLTGTRCKKNAQHNGRKRKTNDLSIMKIERQIAYPHLQTYHADRLADDKVAFVALVICVSLLVACLVFAYIKLRILLALIVEHICLFYLPCAMQCVGCALRS